MATHDFGQDQHAPSVVDMLDMTEGLDQGSQNYTSPLTDLKGRDRGESPLALASGDQRLDHATWHGDRLFHRLRRLSPSEAAIGHKNYPPLAD